MKKEYAYLVCDIIGASKKRIYGLKGDKIEVIKERSDGLVIIKNKGVLFYCRKEKIKKNW